MNNIDWRGLGLAAVVLIIVLGSWAIVATGAFR
jgi:hypothetical protein